MSLIVLISAAPTAGTRPSSDDYRNLPFGCEGFDHRQ